VKAAAKGKGGQAIQVAFLGYGRMAQAISQGLAQNGQVPYDCQAACDVMTGKLTELAAQRGFTAANNNPELFGLSPLVILAVKPHQIEGVLREVTSHVGSHLIVSIAAGVSLEKLSSHLPDEAGIVRVIPNLPALVGQGMSLICAKKNAPPEHLSRVKAIFEAVGSVAVLDESLFNEGTAVSGSGPAYFFLVMEAMIRGAVRMGLTWELARELVLKTALGSAVTALRNPSLSLADLRDQVTSPGGTTAEGLLALEEGALTALFHRALESAADRGRHLV
jgi:pyrroline-5-carboxylate reductase